MKDDDSAAAWREAKQEHRVRNHKHLLWGSLFFFCMMALVAYDASSVDEGQHTVMRVLTALLIATGMTAFFAFVGWLMVRGIHWGFELPLRIQRWRQRRR